MEQIIEGEGREYHLAIGKERHIWNCMERMGQVIVSTTAITQVTIEHGLGIIVSTHVFEFILEIIYAILILIPIYSSASYKRFIVEVIVSLLRL